MAPKARSQQCPLWVTSRHFAVIVMSALPPKADRCSAKRNVGYGPEADMFGNAGDQGHEPLRSADIVGPACLFGFSSVGNRAGRDEMGRIICATLKRSAAGSKLAGRRSLTIPRTAAARRPTRIVKLIDHAKSTDAAHGCSTLLKREEAAIGATATPTTRILGAPSSIIAGQAIFTASPLPISFIAERILCRGDAGP